MSFRNYKNEEVFNLQYHEQIYVQLNIYFYKITRFKTI